MTGFQTLHTHTSSLMKMSKIPKLKISPRIYRVLLQPELKGGDKTPPPASSGDPNYTLMARQRIMSPWLQLRSCSLFSASSSAALVVCVSVIDNKFEYTSFDSFVSANASTAA